ncbi:MAG: serine/threonine-protein kinase [Trueperaceae bacterium]|nr:serine/threonine-protein kinase [Trueperaceae bacterium]
MTDVPAFVPTGYERRQRLGVGQTAVVWLAHEAANDRLVALKLPKASVHANPVLRRMFENEVHITLKLDHPNVVRAFDGRPTGDHAFLSLEYCPGGTLDQLLLERGRLPLERARELVHQVAMGLEHTHDARVLHRDVKPANVFVGAAGEAKLGDFGTGTFGGEDAAERVGTAFYMAPEVFEGRSTSIRSDVYSLGVLAYEVLAGERPFVGDTYDALMFAHLHSLPRDLRAVRPEVGRPLAAVVAKAMSRDPARRYPDLPAFLAAYREATGLVADVAAAAEAAALPTLGRGGARRAVTPTSGRPGPPARPSERSAAGEADRPDRPARRWWWPFGRTKRD